MKVRDQLNRTITIPEGPMRIISLVPSISELIVSLGCEDELVGVTKFCIHPEHIKQEKTIVGGTKNLHLDKIRDLSPTLILANKEENVKEQIEELSKEFPVYVSDVITLKDNYQLIADLGSILNKTDQANEIISKTKTAFEHFSRFQRQKAIYFIWKNPYYVVGSSNIINSLLEEFGFENLFKNDQERYPEIKIKELREIDPEIILLSTEPYPFKKEDVAMMQEEFPRSKVLLVNGEYFSWYGSRLADAPAYLEGLRKLKNI